MLPVGKRDVLVLDDDESSPQDMVPASVESSAAANKPTAADVLAKLKQEKASQDLKPAQGATNEGGISDFLLLEDASGMPAVKHHSKYKQCGICTGLQICHFTFICRHPGRLKMPGACPH